MHAEPSFHHHSNSGGRQRNDCVDDRAKTLRNGIVKAKFSALPVLSVPTRFSPRASALRLTFFVLRCVCTYATVY